MFSKSVKCYTLRVNSGEGMFNRFMLSSMVLAACLSFVSIAYGGPRTHGGETSGGSDQVVYSDILFATKTPKTQGVKICYEKGPKFNATDADIESILKWAFQSWADYIDLKDVKYAAANGGEGASQKIEQVKKGCTDTDDLHVFLGVTPDSVKSTLKKMNQPLAASGPFAGGSKSYWGKGFIWLAPEGSIPASSNNSTSANATLPVWPTPIKYVTCTGCAVQTKYSNTEFKKIILHEMGHIFGNNHIEGTIMGTQLYQSVLLDMSDAEASIWSSQLVPSGDDKVVIDLRLELLANPGLAQSYTLQTQYNLVPVPGATPFKDENGQSVIERESNDHALADAFQLLVGTKAQGNVQGSVVRAKTANYLIGHRADDQSSGDLVITLTDSGKQYVIPVTVKNKVSEHDDSAPLFNGQYGNHHHSSGFSFFGTIQPLSGKPIPVIVNYNMSSAFSIIRLGNNKEEAFLIGNLQ